MEIKRPEVLISKALGISSLVYSMSNIDIPKGIIPAVFLDFYGITNKIRLKGHASIRISKKVAQLRMPDIETINKALKLAWIPRLLKAS